MIAKVTAIISVSAAQRQRAPSAAAPRVVKPIATHRRMVWSGETDQATEANTTAMSTIRKGCAGQPLSVAAGPLGHQQQTKTA